MFNWRKDIKYTSGERNALALLLVFIILLFIYNQTYKTILNPYETKFHLVDIIEAAQNKDTTTSKRSKENNREKIISKAKTFKPYKYKNKKWSYPSPIYETFDPNNIDSLKWLQLGVKPWTIKSIMKYRLKGGRYKSCSDLNKIYNMEDSTKALIIPHCKIKLKLNPKDNKRTYTPYPTKNKFKNKKRSYPTPIYEPFDPNIIDSLKWLQLGVKPWTIKSIIKYRAKGGIYRSCSDLNKVFNMADTTKASIIPHCIITIKPQSNNKIYTPNPPKTKSAQSLQLNTATHQELQTLYGVGPTFAKRIIERRTALGGFHKLSQLTEIYGIEPNVIDDNKNKWSPLSPVQKINLNGLQDNLSKHPYIGYKLAKTIVNYREQHGNYKNIEALSDVRVISDSLYKRLLPYIEAI